MSDNTELIAEAKAIVESAAAASTPNQAQRIMDGEGDDRRLALLVQFVAALEAADRFIEAEMMATEKAIREVKEARRIAEAQRIELYGAQFLAHPLPWESPSEGGN